MSVETRNKLIFFAIMTVSVVIALLLMKTDHNDNLIASFFGKNLLENTGSEKVVLNIISKTGNTEDFFERATQAYMDKNPSVQIRFLSKSTVEAVDYIIKGNDVDAWLSADETGVDLLRDAYKKEHGGQEIIAEVKPIVTSPLVIVGWEERLKVLGNVSMASLYDMISKGKNWNSVGGKSEWGFVNFSHTDATLSNSGIQFLTLLIHNYYQEQQNPKKVLSVPDVSSDAVVEYLRKFEKNITKQEEGSGKFIQSFVLYGPSRYDLGAIYEYYALSNIKNAQGRWGNLNIVYPNPTIWSNKPFVILGGPKSSKQKIEIAKEFMAYLLTPEIQQQAMKEGYRPANAAMRDFSVLESEFSSYGYKRDIPPAVPVPDIQVIQTIMGLAQRIK